MTVGNRHTQALCGDQRAVCTDDLSVFDFAPDLQRLLFGLFFFTADIRNDVVKNFRPAFKSLSGTGNCLIGASQNILNAILPQRGQCRHVALNRAVRLYSDKTTLRTQTLSLALDDLDVFRIHFRYNHRHIRCETVCRVVGYDRAFCLCIAFFQCTDLIFLHVYGTEYEVHHACDLVNISSCIKQNHLLHRFRHRLLHCPAVADSFFISLSGRTGRSRQCSHMEPRVVFQKCRKTLSNHTCCTDNTDLVLFHFCHSSKKILKI